MQGMAPHPPFLCRRVIPSQHAGRGVREGWSEGGREGGERERGREGVRKKAERMKVKRDSVTRNSARTGDEQEGMKMSADSKLGRGELCASERARDVTERKIGGEEGNCNKKGQ